MLQLMVWLPQFPSVSCPSATADVCGETLCNFTGKVLRRNPPTSWRNGVENFPLCYMTYIFSCRKIFGFFIIGSVWDIRCSEEKVLNTISCWMYVNIDPTSAPDTTCCLSVCPLLTPVSRTCFWRDWNSLRFLGKGTWWLLEDVSPLLILDLMLCLGIVHS